MDLSYGYTPSCNLSEEDLQEEVANVQRLRETVDQLPPAPPLGDLFTTIQTILDDVKVKDVFPDTDGCLYIDVVNTRGVSLEELTQRVTRFVEHHPALCGFAVSLSAVQDT